MLLPKPQAKVNLGEYDGSCSSFFNVNVCVLVVLAR